MDLIGISIRRPVFAWMLMSALIIFGAISLSRLGISQMPDIDFPVLNISVAYPGATPEVIESELLDPIEERLLAIEGILEMRSNARQDSGSITLSFDIKRNVDVALQEVQSALSQFRLPTDVDPPVIRKTNPEDQPIMFIGVYGDKPFRDMVNWTERYLLDQFRFIPNVGEVSIGGFSQRNIRVWPDIDRLRSKDFTVTDLVDTIQAQHVDSAAGSYADAKKETRVRWLGEAKSPEEISNLRILRRGGQIIQDAVFKIDDLAKVEDGLSDIRRLSRVQGKEAVSISVRKQRGANEVEVADAVRKKVDEVKATLPEGLNVRMNIDFTRPTAAVVRTTYEKLTIAAIVTILVCFLFLGNFQSALNILFSIPTSMLGTFIIIYFSGFTLNLFTLMALTLSVSIVVDDAIMLLENIVRHYRMGKPPKQAAYDGAREILPAAVAATLAVIAVFIPVVFMSGVTGKFFFQFGVTMSAAVLLSLLEAVTITPMRAATFLASSPKTSRFELKLDEIFARIATWYQNILKVALKRSSWIVIGSVVVFALSLLLVRKVRQEFVPQQDQDIIIVSAQTPPGSSLDFTSLKTKELEDLLSKEPAISSFIVSIGSGGPNSEVNQVFIPTYLVPREERKETHVEVMARLRERFKTIKGMRVTTRDISARGLTSGRQSPVSFHIDGPNLEILNSKAAEIIERLEKEGLAADLETDFKVGTPELTMKPNREKMAAFNVSSDTVAKTLSIAVAGIRLTQFTDDGRRYDIRLKLPEDRVRSREDISKIYVRNNYGNLVPLSQLVEFSDRTTFQAINRLNRQRTVGIFGNVGEGKSQAVVLDRALEIARDVLPDGYTAGIDGAAAGLKESFQSLMFALLLGILVAYMVLAVQFNSFIQPVSILMALPFSISGAILVLWMFDVSLNLFSFIGIIVLMGIAKKNSILLVEFTNHVREHGVENIKDALLEACPVRLRPILMTSAATVLAAMPLVIGNSIGQETRTPMGLTIIGGSIISTIFTLVVVPCIYLLLSKLELKDRQPKLVLDKN